LFPTRDAFPQRPVDILEGFLRYGVSRFAEAAEYATRHHRLLGFVAEVGVLERDLIVGRIQAHGFGELIAGAFRFPDLQQRVGQILANR
jgi:hypothetical protein